MLERWITPSLFKDIKGEDEYSLSVELGLEKARKLLEQHRQTFITRKQIERIKQIGLNAVRVPVGYWLFDDQDGFVGGGYKYLDNLFKWAEEFELQVLICLHGAPGSQNGWDHSGRAGEIGWKASREYLSDSLDAVENIARRYGTSQYLWGIEAVNEPHSSLPLGLLARYHLQAFRLMKRLCRKEVRWVVSDAFRPRRMTLRLLMSWFKNPVLDQHLYQLFTPKDRALDFAGHLNKVRLWGKELRNRRNWIEIIIGEWSAAMDELYQPEFRKAARPHSQRQYVEYASSQRRAFEKARCGWFYWTARTEDGGVWSLLDHPELIEK